MKHFEINKPFGYFISIIIRILFVLVLITCCLNISGCEMKKPAGQSKGGGEVEAITVTSQNTPITFEFIGQTESSHKVEIRARIEGFLDKQLYSDGAYVKANQPTFQIDPKPFQAALQQAKGELAMQKARYVTALANLNRVKPLAAKNAVSQKDLDDATGSEQETAAAVLSAEGQVRVAELNLSYTLIYSPIDGLSSNAQKMTGSYISAGPESLLTYVAKLDPIWVNFSVSENEYLSLLQAEKNKSLIPPKDSNYDIEIVLGDGSVYPIYGHLLFADPSFSQETGTFMIRAEIANPKHLLRPGQFVRINMKGAIKPNAITVPRKAVLEGAKGNFVWVASKEGTAEVRQVTLGTWQGDSVFVESGLFAGDKVVTNGIQKLSNGMRVKIVDKIKADAKGAETKPDKSK